MKLSHVQGLSYYQLGSCMWPAVPSRQTVCSLVPKVPDSMSFRRLQVLSVPGIIQYKRRCSGFGPLSKFKLKLLVSFQHCIVGVEDAYLVKTGNSSSKPINVVSTAQGILVRGLSSAFNRHVPGAQNLLSNIVEAVVDMGLHAARLETVLPGKLAPGRHGTLV